MRKSQAHLVRNAVFLCEFAASGFLFWAVGACLGFNQAACWDLRPGALVATGLIGAAVFVTALRTFGLYGSQRRGSLAQVLVRMAAASGASSFAVGLSAAVFALPLAPATPFYFGAAQFALIGLERLAGYGALRFARRRGRDTRTVLIVGSGPRALAARSLLQSRSEWGLRILGHLDDTDRAVAAELAGTPIYKISDLPGLMRDHAVDEIIVACPRSMLDRVAQIVAFASQVGTPVTILSDLFGDQLPPPRIGHLGEIPALRFAAVHHAPLQLVAKRCLDVVGAAALLIATSPVLLLGALAVRLSSPGSILFRQWRCGLHGRRFQILKLRTMCADAEARRGEILHLNERSGPAFKVPRDPRVTRIGRHLRRWSIDELPQLWNVLRGDMSLVGPRPPLPDEVGRYRVPDQRRMSIRPGLTGLWQVSGRSETGFDDQVKLDLEYIDNWSLLSDLKIIVRTIPAVVGGVGAC